MGRLMQRIEGQPAASEGDGGFIIALSRIKSAEPRQSTGQALAQTLSLEKLPFIKGRAIRQVEATQKIIAVNGSGGSQGFQAQGTNFSGRVAMSLIGS